MVLEVELDNEGDGSTSDVGLVRAAPVQGVKARASTAPWPGRAPSPSRTTSS